MSVHADRCDERHGRVSPNPAGCRSPFPCDAVGAVGTALLDRRRNGDGGCRDLSFACALRVARAMAPTAYSRSAIHTSAGIIAARNHILSRSRRFPPIIPASSTLSAQRPRPSISRITINCSRLLIVHPTVQRVALYAATQSRIPRKCSRRSAVITAAGQRSQRLRASSPAPTKRQATGVLSSARVCHAP